MSRKDDIAELMTEHQRRLHELKLKEARSGINTPPEILTEIEDIKAQIEQLQTALAKIDDNDVYEVSETPTIFKQRVQMYLQGDFSLLSADRKSAAIEAFAAVMGVSSQAIEVYRIYEGSVVFDLGISPDAVQRLQSLLQSNNARLHLLKIERVILYEKSGEIEEWVIREGKFDLLTPTHPTISSGVHGKSQRPSVAGRDQEIGGDVISVSHVGSGAAVAAGRGASASVGRDLEAEAEFARWRADMEARIDALADLEEADKEDLKAQLAEIQEEAAKGKDADAGRLARLINVLSLMSSDIFEVAVATLVDPLAGIGLVIKKIGDKAKLESQPEA